MMGEVYVLNSLLETIAIIDNYKSLIWANRFNAVGDCELYLPATTENLQYLQRNNYLWRPDDDMICIIRYIELTTNPEEGNYLVVKGYDVKSFLDQRIIWKTYFANGTPGNAENFIRGMVIDSLGYDIYNLDRGISCHHTGTGKDDDYIRFIFKLSPNLAGINKTISGQISYKNLGETVRSYCHEYDCGYKVYMDKDTWNRNNFYFTLQKGADRSGTVIFSEEFENLSVSKYVEDATGVITFAMVGGTGEGPKRFKAEAGGGKSVDRHEIFVDAKDTSRQVQWGEISAEYPGGYWIQYKGFYIYVLPEFFIPVISASHLATLERYYPGGDVFNIGGTDFYRLLDAELAHSITNTPKDTDEVTMEDVLYNVVLLQQGFEYLAGHAVATSFDGTIAPNVTFFYKRDYFLGDKVLIQNEFGISAKATITEVVEVNDDNGYSVQPKYEYVTEG